MKDKIVQLGWQSLH